MSFNDRANTEHSGDHMAGEQRESMEERRKSEFFGKFTPDSEGSPTRLHENHGTDRNK